MYIHYINCHIIIMNRKQKLYSNQSIHRNQVGIIHIEIVIYIQIV